MSLLKRVGSPYFLAPGRGLGAFVNSSDHPGRSPATNWLFLDAARQTGHVPAPPQEQLAVGDPLAEKNLSTFGDNADLQTQNCIIVNTTATAEESTMFADNHATGIPFLDGIVQRSTRE